MEWSILTFGKHKGKTLPQVVLEDPDWFFMAYESGEFTRRIQFLSEANDMVKKATAIKVPEEAGERRVAEYSFHHFTRKFLTVSIIPQSHPFNAESLWKFRKKVIDLTVPRNLLFIDTTGGERIALQVKDFLFEKNIELTREICERFFNDEANFDICGGKEPPY